MKEDSFGDFGKEFALTTVTSLLAGVESAHFFSAKLPSTMTIKTFVTTPDAEQAIYAGIKEALIGSAILAGIITMASYGAKLKYWYLPAVATAAISGYLTVSYLNDLKQAPINNTKIVNPTSQTVVLF